MEAMMNSPIQMKFAAFVFLVAALIAIPTLAPHVQAQQASADIQLVIDETLSNDTELQAEGGQTIAVELYATGFSNTVGLTATIGISDPSAITAVTGEKKQGYSFPADPVKWSSGGSEIEFNEGTLAVPSESGSNLKLVGIVQVTLAQGFAAFELTFSSLRFDFADGTTQTASPNLVLSVANLGNLPKTFSADFNLDPGNQNARSRRVNPGSRFPVQMFAAGVQNLTAYEVRVQIDTDAIDAEDITFVPRSGFVVSVPGSDGGSGGGTGGDGSRISADIQAAADETLTDGLSIQAGAGESVVVELYATGFSNTVGLTGTLTLDNPDAVSAVTGEKKQGYSFPADPIKWSAGDSQIEFNEGTLAVPTETGSDLKVIGIVTITLASSDPLNITFSSLRFDFADGTTESATSEVTLAVNGSGGGSVPTGDESRASIDVQSTADDALTSGKSIEAAGGETVIVELFATGFSNTVGLTATLDLDNPAAVAAVSGEKKQGYSFPADPIKWSAGDSQIEFNEGTLAVPTESGSDLKLVGVVSLTLAQGFSSLNVTLSSLRFDFADGTTDNVSPGVAVVITEGGGEPPPPAAPATVEIQGNIVIARGVLREGDNPEFPVNGGSLGILRFRATSFFNGTQITITSVVFSDEELSTTIEPNQVLDLQPAVTDAPIVTDPPIPVTVTDTRAIIEWGTNKPSNSVINYGTDRNTLSLNASGDGLVVKHRLLIEGLNLGTRYFYQVVSTDAENRASEAFPPQPASFLTRRRADTSPPRIQQGPAAFGITLNSAEIVLMTDEAASIEVSYGISETSLDQTEFRTSTELIHRIPISGLESGVTYFYQVKMTDLNDLSFDTKTLRFTTLSSADTTPARILGRPSIVGRTFNRGVVGWNTDEAGNSAVFYSADATVLAAAKQATTDADSVVVEESVNKHRVSLSNLLADTVYVYRVRTIDASGNVALSPPFDFRTRAVEDTTKPRIVRSPIVPRRTDTEVVIAWQTNEPTTGEVQFDTTTDIFTDDDAGEIISSTTPTKKHEVSLTNLEANTQYHYRVSVTDLSGNGPTTNDGQLSFATRALADTDPPVVFSLPVALGITTGSAIISWGADERHSAVIRYGPVAAAKQAGEFANEVQDIERSRRHAVTIAVEPGTNYAFEVETTDGDGNTSTSTGGTFSTPLQDDTDPPSIVQGPVVRNITASSVTIDWFTDEPADSRVSYGQTSDYTETIEDATGSRSHSITVTDLTANTVFHYAVGSSDLSGNVVTTKASGTVLGVSADHTFRTRAEAASVAPTFLEGPLVEFTNQIAIVKWKTDQLANSQVAIGVTPGGTVAEGVPVFGEISQLIFADSDLVTDHSVTVTGLSGGLAYLFQASSTNESGLTGSSSDPSISPKLQPPGGFGAFTTSTVADTQFPVITQGPTVVASTTSSLTIEWQTDESGNSKLNFGTTADDLNSEEVDGTNVTAHKTVVTNLDPGITYAYKVASTDASGNGATESQVAFGSTPSDVDLSAPAITADPAVIYKTDRSATIQWETNEAADSELSFGTNQSDLDQVSSDPDFDTTHTITLTNLSASTTYYIQAASKDQNNNGPTQSTVLEFVTDSSPDITNPVIQNVTFTPSDKSALITWETDELSDSAINFGPAGGSFDFNTGESEDVTQHSLTLTNLTPATEYGFQAESIDRSGNGPTVGETLTFTTFAEGQTPAPDAPAKPIATAGNSTVRVSWDASASSGVIGYILQRSAGGADYNSVATLDAATSYVDGNVENGTEYSYRVVSLGSQQLEGDASEVSDAVTPAADKGPAAPTFGFVQGSGTSPTLVINNSTASGTLTYTFQLSSSNDFTDALVLNSGVTSGAGTGSSDPSGVTAFTVDRTLDDGSTYYYKFIANDGTFDSASLTGNFTADAGAAEFPADITGDGQVNLSDFIQLVRGFGKKLGDEGFIAGADITGDDQVTLSDFIQLVRRFGRKYIQGNSGSKLAAPVTLVYGIDNAARLELVGRPSSSESGAVLTVDALASNVSDLKGYALQIIYDPSILQFTSASAGKENLLTQDGQLAEVFGTLSHDEKKGEILLASAVTFGDAANGEGRLARLRFRLLDDHPQGDLLRIGEGILIDGKFNLNRAENLGDRLSLVPDEFALDHNYPNPFNPATTIRYSVPEAGKVILRIYNVLGQEVLTLVNNDHVAGYYTLRWNGKDRLQRSVASGVYLYRMEAAGFSKVHKMLLLK
jgi:phosphodiesterase/alkaline phosphatase D-like protein